MDKVVVSGILRSAACRGAKAAAEAGIEGLLAALYRVPDVPPPGAPVETFEDPGFDAVVAQVLKIKEEAVLLPLVILESPYAGDVAGNVSYARAAMRDCLLRMEAPLASHLLYTQVLDDADPRDRKAGIAAGLAWRRGADRAVFYVDHGISGGMLSAMEVYLVEGFPFSARSIQCDKDRVGEACHIAVSTARRLGVSIDIRFAPDGCSFGLRRRDLAPPGS